LALLCLPPLAKENSLDSLEAAAQTLTCLLFTRQAPILKLPFFPTQGSIMDAMDVTRLASALQQDQTNTAIQMAVLKKINEVQEQSAMALIAALPQPANNPPHLGSAIDIKA